MTGINGKRLLCYIILVAILITFPYFFTRKTPPGYIIGGDTLVHAAIARGISLGRNPFLDQTYNVYPNWYPFFYHFLVAGISWVFGFSIEKSMIMLQAILAISMVPVMFHIAKELWGDNAGIAAASLSLMLLTAHIYPNPKELAPLLGVLSLLYFIRRQWIVSGILMGLAMWTHYALVLPLLGLPIVVGILKGEKRALLTFLIALAIFSPFIINALIHAEAPPHIEDIYRFWETDTLERKLISLLPPLYLIPFLGLAMINWSKRRETAVTTLLLFIGLIWVARLSPELLKPFGIKLWSSRFSGLLPYIYTLLAAYGLSAVGASSRKMATMFLIILFLCPVAGALNFWNSIREDPFVKVSGVDFSRYFPGEHFLEVREWILNNTCRDDTIATSEEAGMMLNALTGRPIIATMYGHGNTFLDNEQRRKDLKKLFTGDCNEKKLVIEKYRVKYIIIEPFVYERWGQVDMSCVASPVYRIGNVTIMEVKK
ncbi:glycosyltransferase family 39 protein [Pyrococcus yayanosii]|uniref:Uncharacterized protein n=1 Tax=Pyrococcus yayanosii (strain CH1 / JCM 16557) TaxID=529709 RepID=F8AHF6_PYRYC|nr:glycosyltransferase family 39 protein [Pyrococcus yayanosii]AEH24153.1 hypothetical protein PYCH_04630 [Pyrococcus yayanosii CH1]